MTDDLEAGTLAKLVSAMGQSEDPEAAATALLSGCVEIAGADGGRLYLIDLSSGLYESYAANGRGPASASIKPPSPTAQMQRLPLERAIQARALQLCDPDEVYRLPTGELLSYGSRVVIPLLRQSGTCLGLLDLNSRRSGHFQERSLTLYTRLTPVLQLAQVVYDWRSRRTLIQETQQSIRLDQAEGEFLDDVMALVASASRMQFIALRELTDEGSLECIGSYGFSPETSRRSLDLNDLATFPAFNTVVSTLRSFAASSMEDPSHSALRNITALVQVRSFVATPVIVGDKLFGVLSFASSVEYEYSKDEIRGYQSIANGIGVSLSNYRNFHAVALEIATYQEVGTAITAVEVAQAARHEARGLIDDIVQDLHLIRDELRTKAPRLRDSLELVNEIDSRTSGLQVVLDKIKVAARTPAREKEVVGLKELWEQAKSQVYGRLTAARVESVQYEGPEVLIRAAPDWFRQVFINLLLNSADAFSTGATQKRNRRIRLLVTDAGEKSNHFTANYVDNAGGIDFSRIHSVDGSPLTAQPEQAIFAPNVTSKPDGSGWGLALVRRILRDHGCSIDLLDHRNGVTLRIRLPKAEVHKEKVEI